MFKAGLFLRWFQWIAIFLLFLPLGNAEASPEGPTYRSKFCTIYYQEPDQLEKFARNIRPGALTRTLNWIFLGAGSTFSGQVSLGEIIDGVFQRVQIILDMPTPRLAVRIRLFRNEKELSDAYASITGTRLGAPAFYWRRTNTIYLQTEKISVRILAHEMAHAIIDHYFVIHPPQKIAEMLCQYVDKQISLENF